ncbi:MAG TPA: XdhC/CoxI family protein [Pyrinomonadaceae bacterium]|nr:XdhC/CoxI family protein [Pyrinomonadaceae bacterium]
MSNDSAQKRPGLISSAIEQVLESGSRAVIATVVESVDDGPAVGAKLLVRDSGEIVGSLGNSELDEAVAHHAPAFMRTRDEARAIKLRDFALDAAEADMKILFERVEAEPRLVIAGAGHVGASLARLGASVGYQVTLIDDRAEFVDRKLFGTHAPGMQHGGGVRTVAAEDWQRAVRDAIGNGHGVSVAIVTRGHKQDEECLRAAIESKPDYVGMIGSKRRTNIVLDKLREEGADENELKKVRAPIGLDIGAVSPEEVALSILAEIVAERRGGEGASLSSWRRS